MKILDGQNFNLLSQKCAMPITLTYKFAHESIAGSKVHSDVIGALLKYYC